MRWPVEEKDLNKLPAKPPELIAKSSLLWVSRVTDTVGSEETCQCAASNLKLHLVGESVENAPSLGCLSAFESSERAASNEC